MCLGRERVAGLLASLEKRGLDLATLTALPAYQKLLQKRAAALDENDNKKDAKRKAKGSDKCLNGSLDSDGGTAAGGGGGGKEGVGVGGGVRAPRGLCYAVVVCVVSLVVGVVYHYELNTHHGFARFWLKWENVDLNAEQVNECQMLMRMMQVNESVCGYLPGVDVGAASMNVCMDVSGVE